MNIKEYRKELSIALCAVVAMALGLSACAEKHSHLPPGDYMSQQNTGDLA